MEARITGWSLEHTIDVKASGRLRTAAITPPVDKWGAVDKSVRTER